MAAANALASGLTPREASHLAFFGLLIAGQAEAALAALRAHLAEWPRDAMVLSTSASANGRLRGRRPVDLPQLLRPCPRGRIHRRPRG